MENQENNGQSWTEEVEDLVHEGEIDKAITLLETLVEKLEKQQHQEQNNENTTNLQLSTALLDLSKLYSTNGFSLKADDASSRALLIQKQQQQSHLHKGDLNIEKDLACDNVSKDHVQHHVAMARGEKSEGFQGDSSDQQSEGLTYEGSLDDDWEAIADRAPEELLSPQPLPGISKLSIEDPKVQSSKRRGRGTFAYKSQGLYSDQKSDEPILDDLVDNSFCHTPDDIRVGNETYGTRHVLVLADFPPSTKTTDLEKLLHDFKDRGVVIRWVNDTVALAVFKSPSIALEASTCLQCPFTVRVLDENDDLLTSIPPKDLEPPRPRPKTSARTAQRLIAQGMGIKLPSTSLGSREVRKQEEAARRNRIVSRQHMRDDAWGDDVN